MNKENIGKIYSYVVRNDGGFAPNPFWHYCTLACCKPKIRKNAKIGYWVIGTGSKYNVGQDKLIYAMKISEKLTFEQYSKDIRFKRKIPSHGVVNERGDNIYSKNEDRRWAQRPSYHGKKDMPHDLSGSYVLISEHYYYFGRNAIPIPRRFSKVIKKGPGHKCNFNEGMVMSFVRWIEEGHRKGISGQPCNLEKRLSFDKGKC